MKNYLACQRDIYTSKRSHHYFDMKLKPTDRDTVFELYFRPHWMVTVTQAADSESDGTALTALPVTSTRTATRSRSHRDRDGNHDGYLPPYVNE